MGNTNISKAFMAFQQDAPEHAKAWAGMVQELAKANALDQKTTALVYLGILASLGLSSGVPFHVVLAKKAGASRKEVISSMLLGLPAAGNKVTQVLPVALEAFDAE